MLPTPSTSHVPFDRVYEPAEDSYLLLDTLSSPSCTSFHHHRFPPSSPTPLVLEIGTGSGVVLSFLHANAETIFGREVLTMGVDVNSFACVATGQTVTLTGNEEGQRGGHGFYLGNVLGDLGTAVREGEVDVLVFNPPYVPTPDVPLQGDGAVKDASFEEDSRLLELSYAGGEDGMEVTNRLLECLPLLLNKERGCAYILLCAQNKPEKVKESVREWGDEWMAETVGSSGKQAGWEKLVVIRIWKSPVERDSNEEKHEII